MKSSRSWYRVFSWAFVLDAISTLISATLRLFGMVAAAPWHLVSTIKLAAFRVINMLTPFYRESYETDGLSLAHTRQRC